MADKKKKQAGRRAYLNDFHRDLTGAYIYDGSHFHFAGDGWKQVLLRLWALGLVLVVLVLAGGFSGETMAHCVFQILPYLVEVGAVGSVVWALVRLSDFRHCPACEPDHSGALEPAAIDRLSLGFNAKGGENTLEIASIDLLRLDGLTLPETTP